MGRNKFWTFLFMALLLAGCGGHEKRYHNQFIGFMVAYPAKYELKEYRFEGRQLSAELKSKAGTIDIRVDGAGTMHDKMPFDQYVKIAASDQIQNYSQLISIAPITSESGVKGYVTYWKVIQTVPPEDFDKPELYPPYVSGPIYYFPPKEPKYDGQQPLKTVSFSCYGNDKSKELLNDLQKIVKSFRYAP